MIKIEGLYWDEMAKAAGNLLAEDRPEIEEALRNCQLEGEPGFHFKAEETRYTVSKARRQLGHLRQTLTSLDSRLDFRRFNAAANADTSLAEQLKNLGSLDLRLANDEERLSKRNRKGLQNFEIGVLCTELLEIRSCRLGIDVPTQATETSQSGQFHKYLEMAVRLVAIHANAAERAEMLRQGIDAAVKSFQARKADPLYSHQWEYLFPRSERALMKSMRFSNV
jgi:hypothetical protein